VDGDPTFEIETDDFTRDGHTVHIDIDLYAHEGATLPVWPHQPEALRRELRRIALELLESMRLGDFDHEDDLEAAYVGRYRMAAERVLVDAGYELHSMAVDLEALPEDPLVGAAQRRNVHLREAAEISRACVSVHARVTAGD
jgi:hypothetical protein